MNIYFFKVKMFINFFTYIPYIFFCDSRYLNFLNLILCLFY